MITFHRKTIIISASAVIVALAVLLVWNRFGSTTRIAFVNFQAITLGQISKADDSSLITIGELPVEDLADASDYDMVFVNGMGLRITLEQRQALLKAADEGLPVMTVMATNPENDIVSVDSLTAATLRAYLAGGEADLRNMLRYVRRDIDGKRFFAPEAGEPVGLSSSLLYYPSPDSPAFASVAEYEAWLRDTGRWRSADAPVILTGQMGVADSLVPALEKEGMRVYPTFFFKDMLADGRADSIAPRAVINMAHGRLGDEAVAFLRTRNIPLFAPLNVNTDFDSWAADKMGLSGGFMSQSIVMPEIDGAIRPFSLFAHFRDKNNLPQVMAIPSRLNDFVLTVKKHLALRDKPNSDKRLAIFYFKGPGQSAMTAEGLEVVPSLYNFLKYLSREGYDVTGLPGCLDDFSALLYDRGRVFNSYATGARDSFVSRSHPQIITRESYDSWCARALGPGMREQTDALDGPFPGHGLYAGSDSLALARVTFGNVTLIPQLPAGAGDDSFAIVHGTDAAPPHDYVASYLWARYGFGADALMHFGTHGSLEFTPRKQVALGSSDWSDRLIGPTPHFYLYATSNPGEGMIAKRRAYATLVNYLTPPFMETSLRSTYRHLTSAIEAYDRIASADRISEPALRKAGLEVRKLAVETGIARDLRLDTLLSVPCSGDEVRRIDNFAAELLNEKITGTPYTLGEPYDEERLISTVRAMTVDPVAYALYKVDRHRGLTNIDPDRDRARFNRRYLSKATAIFDSYSSSSPVSGPEPVCDSVAICRVLGISRARLDSACATAAPPAPAHGRPVSSRPMPAAIQAPAHDDLDAAIAEAARAISDIRRLKNMLRDSPARELSALVNALNGGFVSPSPGGDPVVNPGILPTGRNMFAINAEATPSAAAWAKGRQLADNTIALYRQAHGDSIPRKVSYTLWSSEFIITEGATVAQALYMLGVEPVRDPMGRVTDLRLIPSAELGRPRIDVVVQTSGQLRDLAASRLFLISRAVGMAAAATDDIYPNYVAEGVTESERHLVSKGVPPRRARELAARRVFGGVNGSYGTGIQAMVEAGDRWNDRAEIAAVYLNNMGASYDSQDSWESTESHAFEAALTRTDVVVQPRQSNTWGALSLDHVYEFMGGINLAAASVNGKQPDAYLSDYRNRSNVRMQEVKEAIAVESRTTLLNPAYIREKMKGGAGAAEGFADIIRNTYGWNVMKEEVIDDELWNAIYDTYVADVNNLGLERYFSETNPAAIAEITAVMLETARKGMWNASAERLDALARLHASTIAAHGPSCTGFVCDNASLRDFISSRLSPDRARDYNASIAAVRAEGASADAGRVMHRQDDDSPEVTTGRLNPVIVAIVVIALVALLVGALVIRHRRTRSASTLPSDSSGQPHTDQSAKS